MFCQHDYRNTTADKATDLLSSIVVVAENLHFIIHKFALPAYVLSVASPLSYLNAVR